MPRPLSLLLATVLLLCAHSLPAQAQESETGDLIDVIRERGAVRMAVSQAPPSFVKNVADGTWSGTYIEMAEALFSPLGVEVEPVEVAWGAMVAAAQAGQVDIIYSGLQPQRSLVVDYSIPVQLIPMTVASLSDEIEVPATWAELNASGLTLSVAEGTVMQFLTDPLTPDMAKVMSSDLTDGLMQLDTGRADLMVGYGSANRSFIDARGRGVLVAPEPRVGVMNAFSFAKGNPGLKAYLDAAIRAARASGALYRILSASGSDPYLYP